MISIESLKESLVGSTVSDLEEAINYFNEQIELQKDAELARIDQQIAELKAKRDAIRPPQKKNGIRIYKEIINPNNLSQIYTTGPHPKWLTQMLKDKLGEKHGNKEEMARVIAELRNGGVQ